MLDEFLGNSVRRKLEINRVTIPGSCSWGRIKGL